MASTFDAPTMDPSTGRALARVGFVLHRVFDGRERRVVRQRHALAAGVTLIGRAAAEQHTITVDDGRASRRHATLSVSSDGMHVGLIDESTHGTFVDGRRVTQALLTDGSSLRVGDCVFVLRREATAIDDADVGEVLGHSQEACVLRSTLAQVGDAKATVLLLGPTGTGKEVAARALHRLSGRAGAFVPLNCSAVPTGLFEAELFGHARGAFTGADKNEMGLVRAAQGGTLFLDEIGDLPFELQAKLLRFLDHGAVQGVGERKVSAVDVRVLAATHKDLAHAVAAGTFRGDLYARLAEIVIPLPPLTSRRDDVLLLLQHALTATAALHPDLAWALVCHDWPFHVREVMKIGSELSVKGKGKSELDVDLVAQRLLVTRATASSAGAQVAHDNDDGGPVPDQAVLQALLHEHHGVLSDIAKATKRSRRQVRRWVEKFGLNADNFRR